MRCTAHGVVGKVTCKRYIVLVESSMLTLPKAPQTFYGAQTTSASR